MPSTDVRSNDEMLAIVHRRADKLRRQRQRRRRAGAAGLALAGVALAGVAISVGLPRLVGGGDQDRLRVATPRAAATSTTVTRPSLTAPEGWAPMAASPLAPRAAPIAVWTGTEMLVWGGQGATTDVCMLRGTERQCGDPVRHDGGAYDPARDRWRRLPDAPLPRNEGSDPSVEGGVWTGEELLVWNGARGRGAAYEPAANRWRPLRQSPLRPRSGFSTTWTGREMVVWGGAEGQAGEGAVLGDGAAYDPVRDRWRMLPGPGPSPRKHHTALWADGRLIVLGGWTGGGPVADVAAYDPSAGRWRRLAPAPVGRSDPVFVWTGDRIVMVGDRDGTTASYDPSVDRWSPLPASPGARDLVGPTIVWTGREVVLLGAPFTSRPTSGPYSAALDATVRTWRPLPRSGLAPRSGQTAVWTGNQLLVWGGAAYTGFTSTPFADGSRYNPGPGR